MSVTLSPEAVRVAGIETALAESKALVSAVALTGTLAARPWTPEEQTAISDAENVDARFRLARANFERLSRLFSQGIVARQDLDSARSERDQAEAAAAEADAKRANLGLSASSASLESHSKIWGLASLPEIELARVQAGESVDITADAFSDRHFRGRVAGISRSADPETRNFTARIMVDDPSGLLRPQMLATFAVSTPAPAGLVIPRSAVLLEGDGSYVYVEQATGVFRRQRIEVGISTPDLIQVRAGLSAGQRIVVRGAQILESERLKSSLEAADTD